MYNCSDGKDAEEKISITTVDCVACDSTYSCLLPESILPNPNGPDITWRSQLTSFGEGKAFKRGGREA